MNLFALMRRAELTYVTIFMLTVVLYVIGVSWYALLIRRYYRKHPEEEIHRDWKWKSRLTTWRKAG